MEEVEPEEFRQLEEEEEEKPRIDELVRVVSLPSLSLQVPITAVQMSTLHSCQHYRFRVGNPMFLVLSRSSSWNVLLFLHISHWSCHIWANAWRNVEGVMVDRNISRKLKWKVLDSCVVPASIYGLETLALSELHQHKLQVCENNWIRRLAGIRRVERRRMKDLREEVGTKACIVGKIVKSRMKLAGHMVRKKNERLPKRSETKKQEGFRTRGRPQLRWEDCVKRELRKAEEEEKWREKANNSDQWKQLHK